MTLDHINRFFLNESYYSFYCAGRLAMPLFAFVFAYNLARTELITQEIYTKTVKRLVFFGLLATPAFIAMRRLEGLVPLNILFTFLVALTCIFFYEKGQKGMLFSVVCFLLGGLVVEYSWAGLLLTSAFWFYCKKSLILSLFMGLIAFPLLYVVNGNNWALAALLFISLAMVVDLKIPRYRYLFWIYYPAHLSVFYLINRFIHGQ